MTYYYYQWDWAAAVLVSVCKKIFKYSCFFQMSFIVANVHYCYHLFFVQAKIGLSYAKTKHRHVFLDKY